MKFSYDPRYNVGYIRFKDKKADAESIKLSEELVVDLAGLTARCMASSCSTPTTRCSVTTPASFVSSTRRRGRETKFALRVKRSRKPSSSRPRRRPTA